MDASQMVLEQFGNIQDLLEEMRVKSAGFGINKRLQNDEDALSYLLYIMPRCRGMVARDNLSGAIAKLGFMKGVLSVVIVGDNLEVSILEKELGFQQGFRRGALWAKGRKTIKELRDMKNRSQNLFLTQN